MIRTISWASETLCVGRVTMCCAIFGKVILLLSLNYIAFITAYCSNFYGCVLWDMSNSAAEDVFIAWHKGLRRVWDLPASTHARLIRPTPLCGLLQLKVELASRCVKFMANCLNSFNHARQDIYFVGMHNTVYPYSMFLLLISLLVVESFLRLGLFTIMFG